MKQAMLNLQDNVKRGLEEHGFLSDDQLRSLESQFNAATNPFAGLETRYQQDKYLKDHLDYLASTKSYT